MFFQSGTAILRKQESKANKFPVVYKILNINNKEEIKMVPEQNEQEYSPIEQMIRYDHINEVFFAALVLLCFIGDILGEISGHVAVFYWLLMVPVFFFITLFNEQAKELKTGLSIDHFKKSNILYWTSAFMSILLILMLRHAEDLDARGAAVAIHIIVAHTMFLLGIIAGLRFYLIGSFLFVTAGITIFMESIVGITIFVAIPVLFFGFYFEKHKTVPIFGGKK